MERYNAVEKYILQNWNKTVRRQPVADGSLLPLPYPFTVPCMEGAFNEMYYWDTYFTNRGLLLSGQIELAKNNCENIAHMIKTYGYMPNGSRTHYIGRSQPPYFALMVADLYEVMKSDTWLADMFEVAKQEYDFWMKERIAPNGLNCYGSQYSEQYYYDFVEQIRSRIELDPERDVLQAGRDYVAEAESGWDFNPRFNGHCTQYNPVDLNALLYRYECLFASFSEHLGTDSAVWKNRAGLRKERMKCMENPNLGHLYDYNFEMKSRSEVLSAASIWPYWVGLITDDNKIASLLDKLELPYGITATEPVSGVYQWGYGKAWAPITLVTIEALDSIGAKTDAVRIATKYCNLIADNFSCTGGLWEKYDAISGEVVRGCEYETPEMMGWTAGAFLFALSYLRSTK